MSERTLAPPRISRRVVNNELIDRHKWIFFALGMSVLLSWNVMITATPYFLSRLHGSRMKGTFNSYLSLTYTGVNFVSLAYATATASVSDSNSRIKTSALFIALSNMLLALSPTLPINGGAFFAFVIFNGMLQACAGSFLQSAVAGLTALFGPDALAAMFTGQAMVGVCVSAVQYVSAATSLRSPPPHSESEEPEQLSIFAFVFFGLASVSMILSAMIHSYLRRLPLYHAVVDSFKHLNGTAAEGEAGHGNAAEDEPFLAHSTEIEVPASIRITRIARVNALYNFTVAWVFIVTLAIFPAITSSIVSVHPGSPLTSPVLFVSFHFVVFNVGDWLGRYLCTFPRCFIWSPKRLAALSVARLLFIPLFLSCNISGSSNAAPRGVGVAINSDIVYLLLLLAFGISNGYIATMGMISVSSPEHNTNLKNEEVDTAATVAQFCLVAGLAIGSALSFAVRGSICGCNPFVS